MEDLKKCPFCNGDASFWCHNGGKNKEFKVLVIECRECFANMELWVNKNVETFTKDFQEAKEKLYNTWNKRS